MQKFCLILILIPMLVSASSESASEQQLVVRGLFAHLFSYDRPEKAKSIYYPHALRELSMALGEEVDPETKLLHVYVSVNGPKGRLLHTFISATHPETKEKIPFPQWLPLDWFKNMRNGGVVTTPKLWGRVLEITCGEQCGNPFDVVMLAKLQEPFREGVIAEVREMDTAGTKN